MTAIKNNFKKWDATDFLDNEEIVVLYLEEAFASTDMRIINKALSNIVRAKSVTKMAKDIGVNRESLYKSLSENGNPSFSTMLKIIDNLGLRLQAVSAANDNDKKTAMKQA